MTYPSEAWGDEFAEYKKLRSIQRFMIFGAIESNDVAEVEPRNTGFLVGKDQEMYVLKNESVSFIT